MRFHSFSMRLRAGVFVLLLSSLMAGSAVAQFVDDGSAEGKLDPKLYEAPLVTAAQAQRLRDYSWARVEGFVQKQLAPDLYLFADMSGSMIVRINDDLWKTEVTPDDKVTISGQIDSRVCSYIGIYLQAETLSVVETQ